MSPQKTRRFLFSLLTLTLRQGLSCLQTQRQGENQMATTNEWHVVFGAGALGLATMRALLDEGKRVRVVTRSGRAHLPAGVESVKADLEDTASAIAAAQGASVVYGCAGLPYMEWATRWPKIQAASLAAAKANDAMFVFGDNLYMYGDTDGRPLREDLPDAGHARKAKVRAQIADMVMQAHLRGDVRAAICRGSDFFGPDVTDTGLLGTRSVGAMLRGKPAQFFGNIDLPHTFTFIEDFGRAMALLGAQPAALGQVWHAPNAETLTTRQLMTMFYEEAGLKPNIQVMGRTMLRIAGVFMPIVRELDEIFYHYEKPYVVESDKIQRAFGIRPTPLREAVRQTLAWYRAHDAQGVAAPALTA
jgi:nucleoside-diphosphate-sugar epimerase